MRRTRARSVAMAAAPLLAASGLGTLSTVFSVTGAGFARVAALPLPRPLPSAARVEVPLGMSWEELARASGVAIPLAGTATLTLACLGVDSGGTGLFTSVVTFTGPHMPTFAEASEPSEAGSKSPPAAGNEEAEVEVVRLPSAFGPAVSETAPDPAATPDPAAPAATPAPAPSALPAATATPVPTPAATPTPPATPAPESGSFAVTPLPSPSGTAGPGAAPDPQPLLRAAEAPPNTFSWTIPAGAQEIVLDTELVGGFLVSRGQIAPIEVSDTRPDGPAFAISGQISDFTPALPGRYIGWRPQVLVPGAGVVAGTVVTPGGWDGGSGLKVPALLGAAESGHPPGVASLGAELHLQLPRQTPAGTYTTTLTITALS